MVVLIEAILLLMLLSFGAKQPPARTDETITVIDIPEEEPIPVPPPQQSSGDPAQPAEELAPPEAPTLGEPAPAEASQPSQPNAPTPPQATPTQVPPPTPIIPLPNQRPFPSLPPGRPRPPTKGGPVYGPVNRGGSTYFQDTERVGTTPNGQPMYAASWYREPRDEDMRAYLSTARGPGYGLITCRTVADYRVEDCIALSEYPQGSQITRAMLAAAWEFRVRPPRRGGQPMIGEWVRIRFDYRIGR